MLMYPFLKLSTRAGRIRIDQFVLAFQSASSVGWNYCLAVMASDHQNPERSSEEG